jgi:hypothetical protein
MAVELYYIKAPNPLRSFLGVTLLLAVLQREREIFAHMTYELTAQTPVDVTYSKAIRYTKYISLDGPGSFSCDPEPGL